MPEIVSKIALRTHIVSRQCSRKLLIRDSVFMFLSPTGRTGWKARDRIAFLAFPYGNNGGKRRKRGGKRRGTEWKRAKEEETRPREGKIDENVAANRRSNQNTVKLLLAITHDV